ncbi:Uncharacterized protein YcsI, UPF0317 family [Faunimonas pinastri]|uniref:Putative hydro-lyase SAMN05216548_101611 n=1 Tax=Faunimonas pinastri TaxID=1855383 RepID=A0A1H9B6U2_9HYPH|nr:putative hydro-lyase [Faunimonas pinastri]SEP83968.1 Uncharacterized protein YcsI, UPF0317 family [Faunimonas pinastri]
MNRHNATAAREVRLLARSGALTGPTANLAPGFVQANLAILPRDLAGDFLLFCQRNPKPCPLVGVSEAGDPMLPVLAEDLDIRRDVPRYRVWENGDLVAEPTDLEPYWRDDLVTFAIGCSFSFEDAMLAAGLPVRHIEQGCNVPMYRTSIQTQPAGPFAGPLVVSMRPLLPAQAIRAVQVTSLLPAVHGAPVHLGDPAMIGIDDIAKPDYGDPVSIREGEMPVFWACGVTPQSVIAHARPDFCITHAPGHMLVTDLLNRDLSLL